FMQIRIGLQGEANISYADSNNIAGSTTPHAMYVHQNGGPGVFAGSNGQPKTVLLYPAPINHVTDPPGVFFSSNSLSTTEVPNMDITASSISMPDSSHYKIVMKVVNL